MIWLSLTALLLLAASARSDKQIKLEDIEKDNLKAAQQAKYEKQYQQYQSYSPSPVQYDQQTYSQPGLTYQNPSGYSQLYVPQQYLQPSAYSGYNTLSSNSINAGYTTTQAAHPFQAYFAQYPSQYTSVPGVQNVQGSQPIAAPTHTQPIVMAISAPALAALQSQAYYQALPKMLASLGQHYNFQYVPTQSAQPTQSHYYTQAPQDPNAAPQSTSGLIYSNQPYVPPFQPIAASKDSSHYQTQYLSSSAPQTFPSAYAGQPDYSSVYQPQASFSGSSVYSNTEAPTFVTVKAPQHLVASQGQQQQFLSSQPTTISPLSNKYLNSPQYLAQNYNTIQSSHLNPKSSFTSGIKSTVSPPLKLSNQGFLSGSPSTNAGISYQAYRNLAG